MNTHIEPVTVLDAETVSELQPPCHVEELSGGRTCDRAAEWVVRLGCHVCPGKADLLLCSSCKDWRLGLRVVRCVTTGIPVSPLVLSVEPLR